MQPKIEISVELLNAILNYLGTKPFAEVAGFINAIQEQAKGQVPSAEEVPVEEYVSHYH